jgi:hypothetical protein
MPSKTEGYNRQSAGAKLFDKYGLYVFLAMLVIPAIAAAILSQP